MADGLRLEPEPLLAAAATETGLDDFGDDAFRERLDVLLPGAPGGGRAGPQSACVATYTQLSQLLKNRLLVEDLLRRHPEILDVAHRAADHHRAACPAPARPTSTTSSRPTRRCARCPYWESLEPVLADASGRRRASPTRGWPAPRSALEFIDAAMPLLQAHARDDGRPRARGDPAPRHRLLDDAVRDDGADAVVARLVPRPRPDAALRGTCARSSRCCSGCGAATAGCSSRRSTSSSSGRCSTVFPDATFVVTHRDPVVGDRVDGDDARLHRPHEHRRSVDPPAHRRATGPTASSDMLRACVARPRPAARRPVDRRALRRVHGRRRRHGRAHLRRSPTSRSPPDVAPAMDAFMADHPRGKLRQGRLRPRRDFGLDAAERRAALQRYIDASASRRDASAVHARELHDLGRRPVGRRAPGRNQRNQMRPRGWPWVDTQLGWPGSRCGDDDRPRPVVLVRDLAAVDRHPLVVVVVGVQERVPQAQVPERALG